MVVGDLIGEGSSRESAVVGQSANLAARVQSAISPNEIGISQATYTLVRGFFELEPLGAKELKGFDEPQAMWRVRGER